MGFKDPITQDQLDDAGLTHWNLEDGELVARLSLPTYRVGGQLVHKIATYADEVDHHPKLLLDYGILIVRSCSHDAGGIATARDLRLAQNVDALMGETGITYQA